MLAQEETMRSSLMDQFRWEFMPHHDDITVRHFPAIAHSEYDSCIISKHLSEIPEIILSNFYNTLSFEHHVYFINIMLTIYQLSQMIFFL